MKKLPKWATTVTPLSKYLALSMLVILPMGAFFYGMYYQRQWDLHHNTYTIKVIPRPKPTSSQSPSGTMPPNGKISCSSNADCPPDYVCAQPGPIIYGKPRHSYCWKRGSPMPL